MQIVVEWILTNYELINPKAKTPVIILHGWGQNSSHWLPLAKEISSRFRLYLLDLPGFGGTKNLALNSDVPEYSQFVERFAAKMGLKKFVLSGHSFGGQVAGDFAVRYPEKLTRLVIIDAAVIRVRGLRTKLKIVLAKIIKPVTWILSPNLRRLLVSLYAAPEYVTANEFQKSVFRQILKYNLGPKLHQIKTPTEIIWGSDDHVIPYKGKFLVENIPNANLRVIYPAGHLPHLTHPAKLAAVLNQILNDESA